MLRCAFAVLMVLLTIAVVAAERGVTRLPAAAEAPEVPDPTDLAGTWLLTMPRGHEFEATLVALKPGEFELQTEAHNLRGVYTLRDGRLEMSKPVNERMVGLVWEVKNRNVVVLSDHPESSQLGSNYRNATLSRNKAAEIRHDSQFQPGKKVTLPRSTLDLLQKPLTVELPLETPYPARSAEERLYLKGYAEGYADTVRTHTVCRSNTGERATEAWREGWKYGTRSAEKARSGSGAGE